ncbi:MAG TPA: hypothetical protein VMC06_08360 [Opitutaceae bacterium]|nr:hypothetical protein [Opitutaceae bacterium]
MLMNTISSAGKFIGMTGICLDRLLKQRSALRISDSFVGFPPLRGGLRILSVAADCIATNPALMPDFYPQPDKIPC